MIIGVARESKPGETRVARGAGERADFPDEAFVDADATTGDAWRADVVFAINAPAESELDQMKPGATLVALLAPRLNPDIAETPAKWPITALSMGAAGSLGAIVRATDPRPEVADQVKSLGGEYLSIESPEVEVSATGYAKEMGEDYKERETKLHAEQSADVDIVITTALIPGRPAPRLITADMVAAMKPGSVVVDMAASNGGNVEGVVADEKTVTANGVTIIGYTDLAGRLPAQASQLYGTNLVNLMKLLTPEKDGQLVLDFDDVVQRGVTVVRDGESTWPPPEVSVSAAPAAQPAAPPAVKEKPPRFPGPPVRCRRRGGAGVLPGHGGVAARVDRAPGGVRAGHRDRLLQTVHGRRLRGRGQPALLPREQPDALRRRPRPGRRHRPSAQRGLHACPAVR